MCNIGFVFRFQFFEVLLESLRFVLVLFASIARHGEKFCEALVLSFEAVCIRLRIGELGAELL
jgi:hypothetical protein